MSISQQQKSSYSDAGVSIDKGNALVERIKSSVKSTHRPGVLGSLGGFGALFDINSLGYKHPILVSGTDGVGTKLKLAIESGEFSGIGIDLVAMCVNDLLVLGAEPLYFLDYYATGSLDVDIAQEVVSSIAQGCQLAGCALTGGETAEMPGMYQSGDFDLAGFCVGVVEKDQILDGENIKPGDCIIGLASSGPHSNGYSLIRKVLSDSETRLSDKLSNKTFAESLLEPTRIYVKTVLQTLKHNEVKGIAHITGGGLIENIPRILPDGRGTQLDANSWVWPEIFQWLQEAGNIDTMEMYRTFNCGIGLVLISAPEECDKLIESLTQQGELAWQLGEVIESDKKETVII